MYVEVLKNCINNKIKTYNSQQYFNKILECFNRIKKKSNKNEHLANKGKLKNSIQKNCTKR